MSFQEKIKQIFKRAEYTPQLGYANLKSIENDVLRLYAEDQKKRQERKQKLQTFFKLWEDCESWCEEQGEACCFPKTCGWRSKIDELKEELLVSQRQVERPKKVLDIADMPSYNPIVTKRVHGVSEGKIFWTDENKITCKEHGACLCVNKERTLWRCPACNEGAYVEW